MTTRAISLVCLAALIASGCGQSATRTAPKLSARSTPSTSATLEALAPASSSPTSEASSQPTQTTSTSTGGLSALNPPSGRGWAALAYDPATQKVLLFGGSSTYGNYHEFTQSLGDTWTWDGRRWSQLDPGPSPAPRDRAGMTQDASHGDVVLHFGADGGRLIGDTWTWSGARWSLMSPSSSPPVAGGFQLLSFDAHLGRVLAFDWTGPWPMTPLDQTWAWDGSDWTQLQTLTPPTNHECCKSAMAYDTAKKVTIMFSHVGGAPATWAFDGSVWTNLSGSGTASTDFAMATDEARSTVVLFGSDGDTWTWDGSHWTARNPNHAPPGRERAAMTYDPVHKVVLLFGGFHGSGGTAQDMNHTWAWNGDDWTRLG